MEVLEIIHEGSTILELDKSAFKNFYETKVEIVKESRNKNYIFEFELQQLQYLINIDATYPKAILRANRLLAKYKNSVSPYLLGKLYRLIGIAHAHIGELQKAMEVYMEALKQIEKIDHKSDVELYELGLIYNNITILFKNPNENEKRLEYIKLSLGIFKSIKSDKGLGMAYNSLGNYYSNKKDYTNALKYQLMSLKLKKKLNDEKGTAVSYGNIAGIYLEQQDFVNAEKYLKKSDEIKTKHGSSYSLCHLYLMHGAFFLKQKNPARAITYLLKCYLIATKHHMRLELKEVTLVLSETYEQMEDFKRANTYLKEHLALEREINDIQKSKITIELRDKYESEKQKRESRLLKTKNREIRAHLLKVEQYNQELKQFAQIASHDFKEPLRSIKMHLMLLEKSAVGMNDQQKEIVNFTKNTAERLTQMLEDLKTYSNLDNLDFHESIEDVDMNTLIPFLYKKTVSLLEPKKLNLVVENLPVLRMNAGQMKKLFSHLITNAFYYNTNKAPKLTISYRLFKDSHVFKFHDNGVGIACEYFTKIFEIFERLESDGNYHGTGIGLAMCKKIVQNMNGKIWVKSKVGIGSVFYISFPATS